MRYEVLEGRSKSERRKGLRIWKMRYEWSYSRKTRLTEDICRRGQAKQMYHEARDRTRADVRRVCETIWEAFIIKIELKLMNI